MEFKKLQEGVIKNAKRYGKKHSVSFNEDFSIVKICEELGELCEAHLTCQRKCRPEKLLENKKAKENLAKEIADVVGMLIVYADIWNIDLEKAIDKKWIKRHKV